ncbi:MAG: hypothetical protein WCO84_05150 [bacterium]
MAKVLGFVSCNDGSCIEITREGDTVILRGIGGSSGRVIMPQAEWQEMKKKIKEGEI